MGEFWEGKHSKRNFCFSGYQLCDNHLGRHSTSFCLGLSGSKPTPYGKADGMWRLWRLILANKRQYVLDHWI